ncbi:MAG: TfoX/Sxy family protein [Clostridiales bacterium]|nr:TfoX/Sxy family protein [Clostridiales bacterium]
MSKLSDLPNIGPVVERQLHDVGIDTEEQLRAIGAKEAWLRIKAIDPSACPNRLYGMEGAIRGIKKTMLPSDVLSDLKNFAREKK